MSAGALANLDSVFLTLIGDLQRHRIGLAQSGDMPELQSAHEVVHGLSGKRLGAEGAVGAGVGVG